MATKKKRDTIKQATRKAPSRAAPTVSTPKKKVVKKPSKLDRFDAEYDKEFARLSKKRGLKDTIGSIVSDEGQKIVKETQRNVVKKLGFTNREALNDEYRKKK